MNTSTTIIDTCDIAAYRAWKHDRRGPAYVRGVPTWVWRTALARRRPTPMRRPAG